MLHVHYNIYKAAAIIQSYGTIHKTTLVYFPYRYSRNKKRPVKILDD